MRHNRPFRHPAQDGHAEQIRRQPHQFVPDLTEVRSLASPGIAIPIDAANLRPDLQLVATGPIIRDRC